MIYPFKKTFTEKESQLIRFLSGIRVFERLSPDEISLFLPYLHLREFNQNEVIFFRNDPSQAFYMIKSGRISLNFEAEDDYEELTIVHEGNALGDNALLLNTQRLYTAITVSEKAVLYVLPQVNILDLFEENVEIKAKMMTSLSEQYNAYTQRIFREYRSSFGFFSLSQTMKD
ncbi:Crp/Fnr family transcriptional regulator [Xanthovirga aplysinae]|uniref:Crp/Fnr family transcriptional regulator n=1 Tax=Xanthovirga aplysinae TaxID=2529853 RepID=UPI0012BC2D62|nr:cyclic nucleotide-binding domain-containing protein [Xanthovirga aplysinae]MTI29265.1 cyclic nucleotide-binding domain-containing protein [Xanthovirga aplysinae]